MKTLSSNHSSASGNQRELLAYPLALCRKAVALTRELKTRLLSEFGNRPQKNQHLVRLALNEAEALAWETEYPYLLFPALAAEKMQRVANWERHQQWVHRTESQLAYAC